MSPSLPVARVWVTREEFCAIYGRTRQWAHILSLRGDFADFGIPTLRILHAYGRRSRWFYQLPADMVSNSSLPSPSQKP